MTTSLKTPSSYYIQIIMTFPPRQIQKLAKFFHLSPWHFLSIINFKHTGMSNVL